jgi:hypothetical protein
MSCAEWLRELLRNDDEEIKQLLIDLEILIEIEHQAIEHGYASFDLLSEEVKIGNAPELKARIKEMADFVRRRFPEGLPPRVQ